MTKPTFYVKFLDKDDKGNERGNTITGLTYEQAMRSAKQESVILGWAQAGCDTIDFVDGEKITAETGELIKSTSS